MSVRKARVTDVAALQELINWHAERGMMLSKTRQELYEQLRDFFVFCREDQVVGSAALHIFGPDVAELRSVAVKPERAGRGIGGALVEAALSEAQELGLDQVFLLTARPDFFAGFGFLKIDRGVLPRKIWADCLHCSYYHDCREIAMIVNVEEGLKASAERRRRIKEKTGGCFP